MISSTKSNLDRIVEILQGNCRPEPEEVMQFRNEEIEEAAIIMEHYHNNSSSVQCLKESVTIAIELEVLLPIIAKLVNHIGEHYSDYNILFAGRDAEPLYDAFRINSGTKSIKDKAVLFPGSKMLISDLAIKTPKPFPKELIDDYSTIESGDELEKLQTVYQKFGRYYDSEVESRQLVSQFLASYRINDIAIQRGERFLLVDTGFKGTVAAGLKRCVQNLYSLEDNKIDQIMIPRLVGMWKNKGHDIYIAKELMPVDNYPDNLQHDFPKTEPVAKKYCKSANFCIALAMQFLPHYHAPFGGIDQEGKPHFHKYGEDGQLNTEIDTVFENNGLLDSLNTSIVNPLGALIVQQRVAQYFSDRC